MSGPDHPGILKVRAPANPKTRVGRWYAAGPADRRFTPGDPAFGIYRIVSDSADVPGCVTVEGPGAQRFPLHVALADDIAGPSVEEGGLSPDRPDGHREQPS